MTNKPGPEGARWNMPDWNPHEVQDVPPENSEIEALKTALWEAKKEIKYLKSQLRPETPEYQIAIDPQSLTEPPRPRVEPLPVDGCILTSDSWYRREKYFAGHVKIRAADFKGEERYRTDGEGDKVDKLLQLTQLQHAELTRYGYTYLTEKQTQQFIFWGYNTIVDTALVIELFATGRLDAKTMKTGALEDFADIPVCCDELARRINENNAIFPVREKQGLVRDVETLTKTCELRDRMLDNASKMIKDLEARLSHFSEGNSVGDDGTTSPT